MSSKQFNPHQWLNRTTSPVAKPQQPKNIPFPASSSSDPQSEVEALVSTVESSHTDLTSGYDNWLKIGFALAEGFGEGGRHFFHRLSRFNAGYNVKECDTQFTACVKSTGHGVTLKTLFHLAKEAGIPIRKPATDFPKPSRQPAIRKETVSETFPSGIYDTLPSFLKRATSIAITNEERDILLLGALTTLSVCFPNVTGIYDGSLVRSNLFLFVTAKASAGKGRLALCRQLVTPIHQKMREAGRSLKIEHEQELAIYNAGKGKEAKGEKPAKPPELMLFIPANNSASGVFQLLSDNGGSGLIFETEGDTLAQAFKSDYGNYSDGFRKAFHHEPISYFRRTDREYVEMDHPCLSAVLSGTPGQVATLIPSAENGLFSRFVFYSMTITSPFKDVFARKDDNGLRSFFDEIGADVFRFAEALKASRGIRFSLLPEQEQAFLTYFQKTQNTYLGLLGDDYMATVRRLGLITFRIAMLFSVLRLFDTGEFPELLFCEEQDYKAAQAIAQVLVRHAAKVFAELPEAQKQSRRPNLKEQFLEALPETFGRQLFIQVADTLKIGIKSAERYVADFVSAGSIHHPSRDRYVKIPENRPDKEIEDKEE